MQFILALTSDEAVTDGPHSDAAEQLASSWIIEAASAEDAVGWAKKAALASGAIEVQPLVGDEATVGVRS